MGSHSRSEKNNISIVHENIIRPSGSSTPLDALTWVGRWREQNGDRRLLSVQWATGWPCKSVRWNKECHGHFLTVIAATAPTSACTSLVSTSRSLTISTTLLKCHSCKNFCLLHHHWHFGITSSYEENQNQLIGDVNPHNYYHFASILCYVHSL